jgi:bidirectional [NiFe] hydrogenase diaphorase subunit
VVCTGTACYIKGAPGLLSTIKEKFGIDSEETTADGKISVLSARCLGSCGLAPAAVFDGEVEGRLTGERMVERLLRWQQPGSNGVDVTPEIDNEDLIPAVSPTVASNGEGSMG